VRFRLISYCLAGLFFAACLVAGAQSKPSPSGWAGLERLATGSRIRVTLKDKRTLNGLLDSITSEGLAIDAKTGQESLPRAGIQRVQWKAAGHRGRNTLIGFAAGAAGGLAIGGYVDSRDHIWLFNPNDGKKVFTAAGAVIGTIVGVVWPTGGWHEIYRAP
jgi:hypothetical protein